MASSAATQSADIVSVAELSRRSSLAGKRVAMVTFSPYPFDPRPRRAVDALVKEGMSVDLVCLADEEGPWRESLHGVEVLRVPLKRNRGGKFAYAYQYSAFILLSSAIMALRSLSRRYHLVYVHNMPDILVVTALIPKAFGAKVIIDLHDPMPELMTTIFEASPESWSVRLLRHLEKWSLKRADLVLTVNIACKRIFASRSCNAEKIDVVMNSPDERIFPFCAPASHVSTKARHERFVIMYHGSIVERNGLDLAVDALAHVRENFPAAELWIYGSPTSFVERVLETARGKGLGQAVHYFGRTRLEDIAQAVKNCDVGVIPNQRNPFTEINTPVRIFEYLALGKPVVAPRTPGIQDYFDKESLLFFEPGDSKDLAQQIMRVFARPREVAGIVGRGQRVYQAHTWEQERDTLLHRVTELLNVR
ncbi:MAG: glycosyltransferase family 4 protein [Candidatus Acidiferrales bacterium]